VLQLEILLLLRERGDRWSVTDVADELRVTAHAVEAHVRDLLGGGLFRHETEFDRYTFEPSDARRRSLVDELSGCDQTMRHELVSGKPQPPEPRHRYSRGFVSSIRQ
jgi:predicted ArsR family transcriptional regulator